MKRLYWFRWAQSPDPVLPDPVAAVSLKHALYKLGQKKNGPAWALEAYCEGRIELDRTQKLGAETKTKKRAKQQTELALPKG